MFKHGRIFKISLSVILVFIMVISVMTSGVFAAGNENRPAMIKVLIGFTTAPGKPEADIVKSMGGNIKHTYSIIPSIAAELPETAIEALGRNPKVRIIEPDIKAYTIGTFEEELGNTWGMTRIGEGAAHTLNYFGTGTKVAIIDSGIDYTHPDLAASYKGGYDFVNMDNDPADIDGHGTHVAGTIAAVQDGSGVAGAAPASEIYALKALEGGSGDFSDIIAALDWCVVNGIQITNNSYGSSGDPGIQVMDAFNNSYAAGILHIASAGNSGNPSGKGDNVGYPAAYQSVAAIAASDINDRRASFSSTGPDVELIAPGVGIYSTWLNGGYASASGTSMASPHVAGVAAQVWAADNSLGNTGVREILRSTAENLGLTAVCQGYGLVRADIAVAATVPPLPVDTGNIEGTISDENSLLVAGALVTLTEAPFETYSDVNGHYMIAGIPVGTYTVTASHTGYYEQSAVVTVDKDTILTCDFILQAVPVNEYVLVVGTDKEVYSGNTWVYVTTVLTFQGLPAAGCAISIAVVTPAGGASSLAGTTGTDGSVVLKYRLLKSSVKGTYTITASLAGYENQVSATTYFIVN